MYNNNVRPGDMSEYTSNKRARHDEPQCPYKGWKLYFPADIYSPYTTLVEKISAYEQYFTTWKEMYDFKDIVHKQAFSVVFKELLEDVSINEVVDLKTEVSEHPEYVLDCLGLAMHQLVGNEHRLKYGESCQDIPKLHARLHDYEPRTMVRNLKASLCGKFVSIKGTVVRVSNIQPHCVNLAFECNVCQGTQQQELSDGKYHTPSTCGSRECRSRSFIPLRASPLTEYVDFQSIRIQEILSSSQQEMGRVPKTVEVELMRELVDTCGPGDVVTVSGIVKVTSADERPGSYKSNKDKCMFSLYILANCLSNHRDRGGDIAFIPAELAALDEAGIVELSHEPNLFRLVVNSLCPSIYGHELVKAGLALALFGGVQRYCQDKNRIPTRGDPHVLVVGDPGLGKSQMLQSVSRVAPRGVYVCGNTTTTSGLTVTLSRESGTNDMSLEAGALVLANQGCCCIDEFDKMGNQHQALLEAMEQQCISIAKSGIVCSLPAKTSIIAAANPTGGHYNKAKTVSENLKMSSALLSRFDLVFIMLDKPDEDMDILLSHHVMSLHAGSSRRSSLATTPIRAASTSDSADGRAANKTFDAGENQLSERLKITARDEFVAVPAMLLKRYVAYARREVQPRMSKDAGKVLQEFYLELRRRQQSGEGGSTPPVTTRQLESLIRLAEARARLELRAEVTRADAADVVDIVKFSMVDTYCDDLAGSQRGCGARAGTMSKQKLVKKFIACLTRVSERTYNSLFTIQEMKQIAAEGGVHVQDFEGLVMSLNNQNYLLKKGPKVYQLQTAGF